MTHRTSGPNEGGGSLHRLSVTDDKTSRRFAVTVFGAITDIHQFAPAELALDRLDTLQGLKQQLMREALHESGAWDFFSQMASKRFSSKRTTPLVIELANG